VKTSDWVAFGRLLEDKRHAAGFTREQLAQKVKRSAETIKLAETGRHVPSRGTLIRLCNVSELNLSWDEVPGEPPSPWRKTAGKEPRLPYPSGSTNTLPLTGSPNASASANGCPDLQVLGRMQSVCPAMHRLFAQVQGLACSDAPVLIYGATGTGQMALAHELHNAAHRGRPMAPLQTVICSGLSASQLENQLGALVPARALASPRRRISGGTLVLQDLSALDAAGQAVLLRFLSSQPSVEPEPSRPRSRLRWIAVAHRDLRELVRQGRFRPELYYRLAAAFLRVPSLCERRADVPLLSAEFLHAHAAAQALPVPKIEQPAMQLLSSHPWPGNLRELWQVLQMALMTARGHVLRERDLAKLLSPVEAPPCIEIPTGTPLAQAERLILTQTLAAVGGCRTACADTLRISRRTLYTKLARYRDADAAERAGPGNAHNGKAKP
jgi:DNA-binding NtrC family response regulator/transcriptional regulator with XRE-family HTH domain